MNEIAQLVVEDFSPLVGEVFKIQVGDKNCELVLTQCKELPALGDRPAELRKPFSLLFTTDYDCFIPQAIYNLSSDRHGEFELFLVRIGSCKCESIFN